MTTLDALGLARELIAHDTVSRNGNGAVTALLETRLAALGAEVERLTYDDAGVEKVTLVARLGTGQGGLALCGHVDTVPPVGWTSDPLRPSVRDGRLFGLGACDMKGPLAALLAAAGRHRPRRGWRPLTLILTSDEETTKAGARLVAEKSCLLAETQPAQGVVAEPTALRVVNAHRSDITFLCRARGEAAHSATGRGRNANLAMIPFLHEMVQIHHELRANPAFRDPRVDPPWADWNIVIDNHGCASNVTVPLSTAFIKFRYSRATDPTPYVHAVREAAARHGVEVEERRGGEPLETPPDAEIVQAALALVGQGEPEAAAYGTDATVLGTLFPCIVFGPGSFAQAHAPEEWIDVAELGRAVQLFGALIDRFCGP